MEFLGFLCLLMIFGMVSTDESTCCSGSLPRDPDVRLLESEAKITYGSQTVLAECPLPKKTCIGSMSVYTTNGTQYTPDGLTFELQCSNGEVQMKNSTVSGIFCVIIGC
ncbi:unnamed protein product [Caenorhabditis auriculariae]|uniref:C6 domain-containing protein n=1 Tax=Caenorhabditis auriculariae TaxID=2777116 RepID=A0A8S1HX72_9PELO|nr:unnamed protein product [Caenorhabditis auriculariae]